MVRRLTQLNGHSHFQSATLLLTGAGGYLAAHLVPELLKRRPGARIYLLFRASTRAGLEQRTAALLRYVDRSPELARRIVPVLGDVTRPDLGLGDCYAAFAETVEEVFHLAADTRLDASFADLYRVNVEGTRNVIAFCERARARRGFARLHHVSTAFVCGNRLGTICEGELDCGQGFANGYEQSKFEAEALVRRHDCLPATVYRPTIVLGDLADGRSPCLHGFHQIVLAVAAARTGQVGGRADAPVNIVPLDRACRAIAEFGGPEASIGTTFHIASGDVAPTAAEMVASCSEAVADWRRARHLPALPPPRLVAPEALGRAWSGEPTLPRSLRRLLGSASPYTSRCQRFDTSASRSLSASVGMGGFSWPAYLHRFVRFTLDNWAPDRLIARDPVPRQLSAAGPT